MEFWADVVPRREQHHAKGLTWELGERSFNGRERNPAFRNLGGLLISMGTARRTSS
ncbi:MAG: hypothetical protein ACYTGX_08155 [Planctomycetota bacterium]